MSGAASDGFSLQTETGNPSLLLTDTQGKDGVHRSLVDTFIPYGQTIKYTITAPKNSHLRLTAMLATTNELSSRLIMLLYLNGPHAIMYMYMIQVQKRTMKVVRLYPVHHAQWNRVMHVPIPMRVL